MGSPAFFQPSQRGFYMDRFMDIPAQIWQRDPATAMIIDFSRIVGLSFICPISPESAREAGIPAEGWEAAWQVFLTGVRVIRSKTVRLPSRVAVSCVEDWNSLEFIRGHYWAAVSARKALSDEAIANLSGLPIGFVRWSAVMLDLTEGIYNSGDLNVHGHRVTIVH